MTAMAAKLHVWLPCVCYPFVGFKLVMSTSLIQCLKQVSFHTSMLCTLCMLLCQSMLKADFEQVRIVLHAQVCDAEHVLHTESVSESTACLRGLACR